MVSPELERLRVPEPDLLEEKRVRHSIVVAQPARPRQSLVRGAEARREVGGGGLNLRGQQGRIGARAHLLWVDRLELRSDRRYQLL